MIEGASNRVPGAPHWDIFRQAQRDHRDLIAAMSDELSNYAEARTEINSTAAGAEILSTWARRDEWNRAFGGDSSQLFGMVVWVTLFDDARTWRTAKETVGGNEVRIYRQA